jgi:hypothetical protein
MVKNIDEISIENLSHFVKTPLAIITGYFYIKTLKDIFLLIYSQAEKSDIYPDFILPDKKIFIDVDEQFDKALMLIIREYIKSMKKKQFFKLKVIAEENIISIWADKDEFYHDISSIESSFLYITGKTMLESVGFKLNISDGRLFFKYE